MTVFMGLTQIHPLLNYYGYYDLLQKDLLK